MIRVIVFFLFIYSSSLSATELTLIDGSKVSTLKLSSNKIVYKDLSFAQTISRKKCNKAVFDQFTSGLKRESKKLLKVEGGRLPGQALQVKIDGKNRVAPPFGKSGRFFRRLPSKVRTLWFTSERVCKK